MFAFKRTRVLRVTVIMSALLTELGTKFYITPKLYVGVVFDAVVILSVAVRAQLLTLVFRLKTVSLVI